VNHRLELGPSQEGYRDVPWAEYEVRVSSVSGRPRGMFGADIAVGHWVRQAFEGGNPAWAGSPIQVGLMVTWNHHLDDPSMIEHPDP
jgi:hypothetical protein